MEDLVSVIMYVYNQRENLQKSFLSVFSQTYKNYELIIIDDSSTDGSSSLCDELLIQNPRLKVIHQLHSGKDYSLNIGIENAKGKYICFIDAADTLQANMLEKLMKLMNNYNVDIAAGNTFSKEEDSDAYVPLIMSSEDTIRQMLIGKSFEANIYAKLFKADIFKKVKFQADDAGEIYKTVLEAENVAYINQKLYNKNIVEEPEFNLIINRNMSLLKSVPNLDKYIKQNMIKVILEEFYKSYMLNKTIEEEDKVYKIFANIVRNDEDILLNFSYKYKLHIYSLVYSKDEYKRLVPVLPGLINI